MHHCVIQLMFCVNAAGPAQSILVFSDCCLAAEHGKQYVIKSVRYHIIVHQFTAVTFSCAW